MKTVMMAVPIADRQILNRVFRALGLDGAPTPRSFSIKVENKTNGNPVARAVIIALSDEDIDALDSLGPEKIVRENNRWSKVKAREPDFAPEVKKRIRMDMIEGTTKAEVLRAAQGVRLLVFDRKLEPQEHREWVDKWLDHLGLKRTIVKGVS